MFTNLIESDSHRQEFKRRSSFFLATVAAYALILFAAGITSIYAYDAHLEAQTGELELLNWVPPVDRALEVRPRNNELIRRSAPSNAPVDRSVTESVRTAAVAPTNDPTKVPDDVGIKAGTVPPVTGDFHLGTKNVDPPTFGQDNSGGCATCNGTARVVPVEDATPPPVPVVVKPPTTQRLPSSVLTSKAISLPQPPYPPLAKQIHIGGSVAIQILVDEQGRVIAAQVISGHPTLIGAAREAALRARFTPTILSGQAVKVQGVITYNFVMQ
jgi:TonB family protein